MGSKEEFLKDQVIEATEEFIEETKDVLFKTYSGLFSFSWEQRVDEHGVIHLSIDSPGINENGYKSTLTRGQKEAIKNQIFWSFETLDPQSLLDIYGKNVRVTLTEDDTEIDTL